VPVRTPGRIGASRWLEDFAAAAGAEVVGRGFSLAGAVGAEGQGLRAVHFVEMARLSWFAALGSRRFQIMSL
jgi:hypothetical protein